MTNTPTLLIVDDEPNVVEFISIVARNIGLRCIATTTAEECLLALTPDVTLVVLDLMLPQVDGVELLRRLADRHCKARVAVISGLDRQLIETTAILADTLGLSVAGYLRKPFRLSVLEDHLRRWSKPVLSTGPRLASEAAISECELLEAIELDQFVVHYQPQIELSSDRVIGFESLVRWEHPRYGLIYPDAFIPRLETLDLIDELGLIVARRGFSELDKFSGPYSSTLAVNVSASSLRDLRLPEKLTSLAEKHSVLPGRVIVEITESRLLEEFSRTLDVLIRLRMKGFQISIDDFGTGYAMMQQLRHIPANEIKIDRSFVGNMHCSSSDRVFVEKTIEIGHELGLRVVAEGVETIEQLEFLRAAHCDVAQGYLFSRPLGMPQLGEWLAVRLEREKHL